YILIMANNQQSKNMTSPSMDMTTIIHIGVELLVAAGLAFWIHSKTSKQQEQITALEQKVTEYEKILKNQGEVLTAHENFLRQLYGNMQQQGKIQTPQPVKGGAQGTPKGNIPSPKGNNQNNKKQPVKKPTKEKQVESISDDEEDNRQYSTPEDLDDLIRDEISGLQECEDGECEIES